MEHAGHSEAWEIGVIALVFLVLTIAAARRAGRTGRAGWWLVGMFGSLALYLTGSWVEEAFGVDPGTLWERALLCVLLVFPYLLLRFAATFRPVARWAELAAGGMAMIILLGVAALPDDNEDPAWISLLLGVMLVYWLGLSALASRRLWQAGRHQPSVARRRMRLMSVATAVLAGALLLTALADHGVLEHVVLALVLLSGILFAVGYTPPRAVMLSWREPEDQRLRQAMMDVLEATSPAEIAARLLPPLADIVGAPAAVLLDTSGVVVATYGAAPEVGAELPPRLDDGTDRHTVPLQDGQGELVVWTSSYTPFFAQQEFDVLHALAAFASLALSRAALLQEERAQQAAIQESRLEAEAARDEAHRANTAKSDFLSRMSHELRTPLNAILGFGQLLELSDLDQDDREGVAHILKAGQHLLALINDVLDLSRIEAGALPISLEPVHAGELVQDAVALIRPLADARAIRLEVDCDEESQYVRTDRQRCRQVLLNLLSNAVKYNRDGGSVRVICSRVGETSRIAVQDSGPGIDPGRRERLFEPFERLGAEASGIEGTGLGLALTRQLIQAMGGDVGVDSVPGEGSVFWISLPSVDEPAEPAGAVVSEVAPVEATGVRRSLLLVEDNLANLRLVEALLRRRPDISLLPAMSGQLALDLAHQHLPDVIVLDLHLPDLPGQEVLQRLKADPRTRDIPVLIASADATPGRLRQLTEEGAFGYISKPLELQGFLELLDRALAGGDAPPAEQAPEPEATGAVRFAQGIDPLGG